MASSLIVNVKTIHKLAKLPKFAHSSDACADLYSIENQTISPGEIKLIKTGLVLEIPRGYEGQVRPRSGLALKSGITILNSPGTIDSVYRGEVGVMLIHLGKSPYEINKGDRIAQLAIRQAPSIKFEKSEQLENTSRGDRGFGSTGK